MAHVSLAPQPAPGDIILRRADDGSYAYTLCTAVDLPQIRWTNRAQAIAHARRFAEVRSVDVWQCDDKNKLTKICEHRCSGVL